MTDEFEFIDQILQAAEKIHPGAGGRMPVPPGDDACLLPPINRPVITTDTQREMVHFSRKWQRFEEIGYKAVTVTLSDLAASYARPVSLFVNLGLPTSLKVDDARQIYTGIGKALAEYNCSLGGGNLSDSSELSLDLFAVGEGRENIFPLRSKARCGDHLYCTGFLGLARVGLEALQTGLTGFQQAVAAFKKPRARFDAAEILAQHQVDCVIDISDGLKGDALHIATASNLSLFLEIANRDIAPDVVNYCRKKGIDPVDFSMAGGEDYELLFSCSEDTGRRIRQYLPEVFPVGHCRPFSGDYLLNPPTKNASFRHVKSR